MADFEPVLFRRINKKASPSLDAYRADGGYKALEKALAMSPEDVIKAVIDAKLRGRGGAGFPCGVKWTFLPKNHPGPIYLCINADESEPCTFNNRILMEEDPHQVLEGILIACYAIKASRAFYYVRYEYGTATRATQKAIDELYAAGLLGKNILGKQGFDLDVFMHRGAGAYICGEETGLIESLEGKRAWPRVKPPFPAVEGAFRKPTIVNNVETLACVTHILDRGVEWFKSIGTPADPKNPRDVGSYGPKLYCISGHVNNPCCVELPCGVTTRELIDKYGGGVWKGKKAKAVIPGGLSTGFLAGDVGADIPSELDTRLDFVALGPNTPNGCLGLGTAAITVIDEDTPMVDVLHNICRFFEHESCGQCTPCREGTGWMLKIVDRLRRGLGRREDLDVLEDVGHRIGMMPGTTICGLADGAGWPIKQAIRKYRKEFESYVKGGKKTTMPLDLVAAHH